MTSRRLKYHKFSNPKGAKSLLYAFEYEDVITWHLEDAERNLFVMNRNDVTSLVNALSKWLEESE